MITETDIEAFFAKVVLGIIKNPAHKTNVDTFCSEYHINRNKPTSKSVQHEEPDLVPAHDGYSTVSLTKGIPDHVLSFC